MNRRDVISMLRLPRAATVLLALVLAYGFVSDQDYQDQLRIQAERCAAKRGCPK